MTSRPTPGPSPTCWSTTWSTRCPGWSGPTSTPTWKRLAGSGPAVGAVGAGVRRPVARRTPGGAGLPDARGPGGAGRSRRPGPATRPAGQGPAGQRPGATRAAAARRSVGDGRPLPGSPRPQLVLPLAVPRRDAVAAGVRCGAVRGGPLPAGRPPSRHPRPPRPGGRLRLPARTRPREGRVRGHRGRHPRRAHGRGHVPVRRPPVPHVPAPQGVLGGASSTTSTWWPGSRPGFTQEAYLPGHVSRGDRRMGLYLFATHRAPFEEFAAGIFTG